jgi:1,4-dihydroxy-2-naphthoyl-CoA hydrolase
VASPNPQVTVDSIRQRISNSFPDDMGIEPMEITDEHTVGRLVVERRHLHPGGQVHGGVWVALTDTIGAWQTFRQLPPGYDFTTVELKLNVFAGATTGDELIAEATHLHAGRSTHVLNVGVMKGDKRVANLVLTQFVLVPPEPPPGEATAEV